MVSYNGAHKFELNLSSFVKTKFRPGKKFIDALKNGIDISDGVIMKYGAVSP